MSGRTIGGLPLVVATGSPEAIGSQYANAAGDRIEANLDRYLRRFRDDAGLDRDTVRRAGGEFRAETTSRLPRIAGTLDALADSGGWQAEDIYALNARTELLLGAAGWKARDGCTSLGVEGTHSASGAGLLGQNWDWQPQNAEALLVLATSDEHGLETLGIAEAGMLAKTGLNSAGIGVCVNILASDRDGRPGGVPYHVILRAALEARSFDEAVKTATECPRSASINVVIGARTGQVVDLELVPGHAGHIWPVDGVVTHANHLEASSAARDRMPFADAFASSCFRTTQARELMAQIVRQRPASIDDVAEVLRHHDDPHSICVHADPAAPPARQTATLASVVLDLASDRLIFAAGPPCSLDYATVGLRDLFQE